MAAIPTVTIYRDGARRVVNKDDVELWLADGWTTDAPAAPEGVVDEKPAIKRRQRRGTSRTGDLPMPTIE